MLNALQLEHCESRILTDRALATVAAHLLSLLLEVPLLKLQEKAPTYKTFIDPPYEFDPRDCPALELNALQFEQGEWPTLIDSALAEVIPQVLLLLLLEAALLRLQEYAPTCKTLKDPPYEFIPVEELPVPVVDANESTELEFWTRTVIPLALVTPQELLLLFDEL